MTPRFLVLRLADDVPEIEVTLLFAYLAHLNGVRYVERFSDLTGLTTEELLARLPPKRPGRRKPPVRHA